MITEIIISIALIAIVTPFIIKFIKHKSLYPFMPFKYNFRRRLVTFVKTLKLLKDRNAKIIIETVTSRKDLKGTKGDGAFTIVFGKWAKENGAKLHSIDFSEASCKSSKKKVINQGLDDSVTVHLNDSIEFLNSFDKPIDLLYLDSYDYSRTDKDIQIKSQEHHLK
jgi:hypothetical protein